MNLTVGVNNPNALSRQVAQAIWDGGQMTVDDLASQFPDFTRRQVHKALMNAKVRGWVWLAKRGTPGGVAGIWARTDGVEPPIKETKAKPPASVWELGNRMTCDKWPPPFEGGRVYVTPEETEETA